MPIKRHKRKLADGSYRTYTYQISKDGTDRQPLSIHTSEEKAPLYRRKEFRRTVAALQANSSLLIVGETGCGKSFLAKAVAEELEIQDFQVATTKPGSVKQILLDLAFQLGVDTESLEGKALSTMGLMKAIADWLFTNTAFLICDDAHTFPVSLRCWLDQLNNKGVPMLLLATFPPARDIFLKLPRIELEPLSDRSIRSIMMEAAYELDLELTPAQLASLQQRTGGNPMLAKRVVREEYLGLEGNADHTQYIDGTPFLIATLMVFMILRFLGKGFNNTSLYLLGGIITVAIGIVRIMLYSLPKKSGRLGQ